MVSRVRFSDGSPNRLTGGCGGIGRRAGLRIRCLRHGSSSLFIRTTGRYICESGSVVERCLAKANVASSNLVSRSNRQQNANGVEVIQQGARHLPHGEFGAVRRTSFRGSGQSLARVSSRQRISSLAPIDNKTQTALTYAPLAQLVEQLTLNQWVQSSSL